MDLESLTEYIHMLRSTSVVPFCPEYPTTKQLQLMRLHQKEVLYGGSAGGGKSVGLLMAALQYVNEPEYAAMIIRRSYADLSRPGALMDRAHRWLSPTQAHWNGTKKEWRFPSGAVLTFAYMASPGDEENYQGSELHFCGFDELTQLEESQYLYMFSRTRRVKESRIPIRIRAATNPGGPGHQWVKERFIDKVVPGRVFIPAGISDNPHLDAILYAESLSELDETTRRQLLFGEWITDAQSQLYKYATPRNDADNLPSLPEHVYWERVLGIDLGASQIKATTAFIILCYSPSHPITYVEHSECHAGMYPASIAERILELKKTYGEMHVTVDEGALGKGYGQEFRRRYHIHTEPAIKSDKLGNRRLINGAFERGDLQLLPGNDGLIKELIGTIWDDKGLDAYKGQEIHLSDALLYAFMKSRSWLAQFADKKKIEYGTQEWYNAEEKRLIDQMENNPDKEDGENYGVF